MDESLRRQAYDLLVPAYIWDKQDRKAVRICQDIITRYPNTDSEANALFSLFMLYRHQLADATQAATVLADLINRYPHHELTWIAQTEAGLEPTGNAVAASLAGELSEKVDTITSAFKLEQAYPNPFAASTTIAYQLPQAGHVRIAIYNAAGQLVRTLADEEESAGQKSVTWDGATATGERAPNGVYLYRLEANGYSETKRMALLR